MPWDAVEDTITMERWDAYEREWLELPLIDDLAAAYLEYKPPSKPGQPAKQDGSVMTAADFMAFVGATGGSKLGPGA